MLPLKVFILHRISGTTEQAVVQQGQRHDTAQSVPTTKTLALFDCNIFCTAQQHAAEQRYMLFCPTKNLFLWWCNIPRERSDKKTTKKTKKKKQPGEKRRTERLKDIRELVSKRGGE